MFGILILQQTIGSTSVLIVMTIISNIVCFLQLITELELHVGGSMDVYTEKWKDLSASFQKLLRKIANEDIDADAHGMYSTILLPYIAWFRESCGTKLT